LDRQHRRVLHHQDVPEEGTVRDGHWVLLFLAAVLMMVGGLAAGIAYFTKTIGIISPVNPEWPVALGVGGLLLFVALTQVTE